MRFCTNCFKFIWSTTIAETEVMCSMASPDPSRMLSTFSSTGQRRSTLRLEKKKNSKKKSSRKAKRSPSKVTQRTTTFSLRAALFLTATTNSLWIELETCLSRALLERTTPLLTWRGDSSSTELLTTRRSRNLLSRNSLESGVSRHLLSRQLHQPR